MSVGIDKLASELQKVIEEKDKNKKSPYDTEAEVVRVDSDVVWVKIPGGVDETPAQKTVNAKEGDKVQVRVSGGRAFLVGNGTNPPTDDTVANVAISDARDANQNATAAGMAAEQAIESANTANEAATKAQTDAAIAHTAATEAKEDAADAKTAATEATEDAAIAHTAATEAKADAADAKTAANEAKTDAQAANTAATEAKADAARANTAANDSLSQLSIVEDVVGTLNWITTHATYKASADTEVHAGKWYFTKSGDTYNVVTNPTGNPSAKGYYEVDTIDEAVSNYVASHIALTNEGLYLTKDGNGYKILLANDGLKVYDPEGHLVSTFGESIILDSSRPQTIGNNNVYIKYYDKNNDGTPDSLAIKADEFLLSSGKTIQEELEGVENWFYSVAPTTSNPPASSWTTDKLKEQHLRDIYFDTTSGKSYRWAKDGTAYKWVEIEDVELAALAKDLHDNYPPRSEFTVAPDKIQSTVSAAQTAATDAANTATDNKLESYSTTTQMNSAIEQKAGEITASVSSTYETKSDATSKLDTAKGYTDSEITSAKAEIKVTTDGISTEVSKKTDKSTIISTIRQSAETVKIKASQVEIDGTATFNAIKSKADAAYDAKGAASAVQTNLDNLQIGGRNLVWDTEWNNISTRWTNWGSPTTREIVTVNGKRWLHLVTTASPYQGYSQAQDKRNGYGEIKAGDKVIISYSAYAKTDGQSCAVGCHWRNSSGTIVAQDWLRSYLTTTEKRYTSAVFTIPNDAVGFNIMIGDNSTIAQEIWMSQVKLEFGTKATDWTPAPEDVQAEIDAKKNIHTLMSSSSGSTYANLLAWSKEGRANADWGINTTATPLTNVKVGDICRVAYKITDMGDESNRPYAYVIGEVTKIETSKIYMTMHGLDSTIIDGGNILTNSIGANQIKANAITADKIAANAITIGDMNQDAKDKVLNSNINVGGRNLLGGTANAVVPVLSTGDANNSFGSVARYNSPASEFSLEDYDETSKSMVITSSVTGNRGVGWYTHKGDVVAGETYTFSCRVKSSVAATVHTHTAWRNGSATGGYTGWTAGGNVSLTANEWTDYSYTFTPDTAAKLSWEFMVSLCFTGQTTGVTCRIAHAKFEKGNKATDWEPAPAELAATATSYITDIGNDGIRVHDSHTPNNSVVINSDGTEIFKGGTDADHSVAAYGDSARIGAKVASSSYLALEPKKMSLVGTDSSNTPSEIFTVGNLLNTTDVDEFTGNGSTKKFHLTSNFKDGDPPDLVVKVNNVTKTKGTDYTHVYENSNSYIVFTTAPAADAAIEVSYTKPWSIPYMNFVMRKPGTIEKAGSYVLGYNCEASGNWSHASGYYSIASNYGASADGYAVKARGPWAHAEGSYSIASGDYSHAEGRYTTASEYSSHAEGLFTQASGKYSHAEGENTKASGESSHAEGSSSGGAGILGAYGANSHVEGYSTSAIGNHTHAEGYESKAEGSCSHAEGYKAYASGKYSHAAGWLTESAGECQTVIGKSNIAQGTADSHVDTDPIFIIGNGTASTPSNALVVKWNGDIDSSGNKITLEHDSGDVYYVATRSDTDVSVAVGVGGGGANHGIYSYKNKKWLVYYASDGHAYAGTHFNPATTSTSTSTGFYLGLDAHRWKQLYCYSAPNVKSDKKDKDIVGDLEYAKEFIMRLKPIEFQWKDSDHKRIHMGFIAQDVAEAGKKLNKDLSVYEAHYKDREDNYYGGEEVDDEKLSWSMMYSELIAPMVKVIQDQEERISKLETLVEQLLDK